MAFIVGPIESQASLSPALRRPPRRNFLWQGLDFFMDSGEKLSRRRRARLELLTADREHENRYGAHALDRLPLLPLPAGDPGIAHPPAGSLCAGADSAAAKGHRVHRRK